MLGVVVQQSVREREHPQHALVGDPVVDGAVLTPRLDEAAPTQTSQMIRPKVLGDQTAPKQRDWKAKRGLEQRCTHLAHIGKRYHMTPSGTASGSVAERRAGRIADFEQVADAGLYLVAETLDRAALKCPPISFDGRPS